MPLSGGPERLLAYRRGGGAWRQRIAGARWLATNHGSSKTCPWTPVREVTRCCG
jgi:hypothetical protein